VNRLRILFVARPYAIHTSRWINQVADQGWDLHLFPSSESPPHTGYRNLTIYYVERNPRVQLHDSVKTRVLWPLIHGGSRVRSLAGRLPPKWTDRAEWLARIIRRTKPDIVHALEFQEAAYLVVRARALLQPGEFPPLIVSNWGSDIYLYGPMPDHTDKIRQVLKAADYYGAECERDVTLAHEYGFTGTAWPVLPAAGGFDIENMRQYAQPGPTSQRRVIALKGYQHWAGRSLFGLRALELCADVLRQRDFSVAVYSIYNPDVHLAVARAAHRTGLRFETMAHESREDVLRVQGRARVSIGLSISDGLSTSALEAVIMGAFPVQSDTSCLCELLRCGEVALMVPPEDPAEIAAAITRAATDDELVDRAAEANAQMARARLSASVIQPRVVQLYEQIAAGHQGKFE
jgi:glycosyltransferase involved in cell wall biosynthesis